MNYAIYIKDHERDRDSKPDYLGIVVAFDVLDALKQIEKILEAFNISYEREDSDLAHLSCRWLGEIASIESGNETLDIFLKKG